jgi:hypothetical protein
MKLFLRSSRAFLPGMLLVVVLCGMTTLAAGAELDSVVVMAIDPEEANLSMLSVAITAAQIDKPKWR